MSAHPYDHGHTVAGWTGFGIAGAGTAVVGFGIVTVSGPLLVGGASIALAGLVGLNAASEKVSFTKVIAGNPTLNAIDMWGRRPPAKLIAGNAS